MGAYVAGEDKQPHMVTEVVAYMTEPCHREPAKRRMASPEVKQYTPEEYQIRQGTKFGELLKLLPALTLIQEGQYRTYMAIVREKIGMLTNFPEYVYGYLVEAATLHPDDFDNVPPHLRELDKAIAMQIIEGKGLPMSKTERIKQLVQEFFFLQKWETTLGGGN